MAGRDRRAHARDARIRRRRLLLLLAAAVALGLGVRAGAASNDGSRSGHARREPRAAAPATGSRAAAPRAPVDRLTLARQVGQLLMLRFAGPTVPEYVGRALREQRAAGAILFADNVVAPAQVRALTRGLRDAGGRPLVAVDQEGGDVRIVRWAPPAVSAPRQQAAGSVGADARAAASALRDLGITVSLAPVADVPSIAGAAL